MKGTVYRRGSTWTYQLTTGSGARGDRKHHSKGGFRLKTDAQAALSQVLARLSMGDDAVLVRPVNTGLGEYLQKWLEARQASSQHALKPTTVASYRDCIRAWIVPHIGCVPLSKVTAGTVTGLVTTLREKGSRCRKCGGVGVMAIQPAEQFARDADGMVIHRGRKPVMTPSRCPACDGVGGKPLGDRSVVLAYTLLNMAFSDAVEAGDLGVSPVKRIPRRQRPTYSPQKQTDRHWDRDEARSFIAATKGDRLHALYAMALDSGARRGELSAIRWSDLDLDQGLMGIERSRCHVGDRIDERSPKTKASVRVVELDPRTIATLRAWRSVQRQDRLTAGPGWKGGDLDGAYVFTDEEGVPFRPDGLSGRFDAAVAGAGVPRIPFHGMRHTSATLLLAAGVPVHVVSQRLGHASIVVTLGTYGHVLPSQGTDAARVIGGQLYGEATGS